MKRRVFVGGALSGLAVARPGRAGAAAKPGDVPKRRFGKTGVDLTVIGQAGGRFGNTTFEEAKAVTLRAYELGINYFDNAHSYWNGRSEEVYGEVLKPFRKDVFITTKTTERTRKGAEEQLHTSLKRLQTDYVDLWQIHSVSEMEDVEKIFAPGGALEAFEAAKKAGTCRFFGFTGHHDPHVHAEMLKRYDRYDSILMPLNAADPSYLSFEKLVLPEAVRRGMGIQGMKNFGNAKLLQEFNARDCLRYVLSLPIHCTAVGCTTVGQIEDDVRIAREFQPMSTAEMDAIRKRAQQLAGPALEDWKRNIQQKASTARPSSEYVGG